MYGHARLGLPESPRSGLFLLIPSLSSPPPSLPLSPSHPLVYNTLYHSFLLFSVCENLFVVTHSFVQCSLCSLSGGLAVSSFILLCGKVPCG